MTDENHEPQRGPFPGVMGPHTSRAVERLKTGKPGDTVTRDGMAQVIGRDCAVGSLGYGNVRSAIKHVIREYGIVWQWSTEIQAWQCLDDDQRVSATEGEIHRGRRRVKQGLQIALTVDAKNLTDDRRREHELNQAAAGMALLSASGAFRKRLKATGSAQLQEPDAGKLIELMKR